MLDGEFTTLRIVSDVIGDFTQISISFDSVQIGSVRQSSEDQRNGDVAPIVCANPVALRRSLTSGVRPKTSVGS